MAKWTPSKHPRDSEGKFTERAVPTRGTQRRIPVTPGARALRNDRELNELLDIEADAAGRDRRSYRRDVGAAQPTGRRDRFRRERRDLG